MASSSGQHGWRERPLVTCIVPAYNYGGWIGKALDSALAQPQADVLEIVVVDDGSTDDTPDVVAAYGERVRYVRKENGGLNSSVSRGIDEARGEFITLLDADDVWPEDRLTPLLEVMDRRPEVGLVYGEMNVIDADGELLHASFLQAYGATPVVGRGFSELITRNTVSGGASLFRAALRSVYSPIPPQAAYADWWLAVSIARVAELAFVPHVVNCYRMHGENMGLGRDDKTFEAIRDHELKFRRWMLASAKPGEVPAPALLQAHGTFETLVVQAAQHYGVPNEALVPVSAEEQRKAEAARERAAAAAARADLESAVCGLVNALAQDPFNVAARNELELAAGARRGAAAAPPVQREPLEGTRGFATLAFADEIVADPALLSAYAERFSDDDDATLVIWAPDWTPDEAITRLSQAIASGPEGREVDADVLVEAGEQARHKRDALTERVDAVLTRRALPGFLAGRPAFAASSASDLRGLAEARWVESRRAAAI
jgi:hypothetical protein